MPLDGEPREKDFDKLKKLARFLVGVSEAEYMFEWQSEGEANHMKVYTDSDWAGCDQAINLRGSHTCGQTHLAYLVEHTADSCNVVSGGRVLCYD